MKAKTILRLIRESRRETVSSMAKRLNLSISRYYMIEAGERHATPDIAKLISELLRVQQEDIFLPRNFTARETAGLNTDLGEAGQTKEG